MTQVLVQQIDRYQQSLPIFSQHEIHGDLTAQNVLNLLSVVYKERLPNLDGFEYQHNEQCWCIWGDEEDTIITIITIINKD